MELLTKWGPFVALVAWVLWKNDQREARYLDVIASLSEEIKERLMNIEKYFHKNKDKE